MRYLRYLKLNRTEQNEIHEIPPQLFQYFCYLEVFAMTYQNLKHIKSNSFEDASARSLSGLDLSHNEIKRIEAKTFQNLRSIYEINLSFNEIVSIGEGAFEVGHLQVLNLQHNRLSVFQWEQITTNGRAEYSNANLRTLNLSHNLLTAIPTLPEYDNDSFYRRIKEIDLSFNQIKSFIFDQSTMQLCSFNKISLQNNQFSVEWDKIILHATHFVLENRSIAKIDNRMDFGDGDMVAMRALEVTFANISEAIRVNADFMGLRSNGIEEVVVLAQTTKLEAQDNAYTP